MNSEIRFLSNRGSYCDLSTEIRTKHEVHTNFIIRYQNYMGEFDNTVFCVEKYQFLVCLY